IRPSIRSTSKNGIINLIPLPQSNTMMERTKKRIAAMADIHVKMSDRGSLRHTFDQVGDEADVLLICGDLTDTRDEDDAKILAEALDNLHIPVIGVLGNHDFERGRQKI